MSKQSSTRIPEFRDLSINRNSMFWRDRRGGCSAMVFDRIDGLTGAELRRIFKRARLWGLEITRKLPLIVCGVCTPIGETATFSFVQMTSKQLDDLDEAVYAATGSTAPTDEEWGPDSAAELLERGPR